MKFKSNKNRKKFLNDEKYFESLNDYCFGKTQEEAGEIFREIIKEKELSDSKG